jgi:hypothetical protein
VGLISYAKGDLEGAVSDLTKAIDIDPSDADTDYAVAWLLSHFVQRQYSRWEEGG